MHITDETLRAMIRDYQGFELTDEELALVRLEVDAYTREVDALGDLDLSAVPSGRLLRAQEGGQS